ncbi:MAG: RHS repeat-associated core domain-containing protein, partial [Lachnospiraceae bacterium]|nr:RHS repeat-associated core domain-containing protein [Lachnospiraceae bacterium]
TYFAQAREYRPETGRFHAQDVVAGNGAEPVTLNRYTYCTNSPINYFDPLGLEKM